LFPVVSFAQYPCYRPVYVVPCGPVTYAPRFVVAQPIAVGTVDCAPGVAIVGTPAEAPKPVPKVMDAPKKQEPKIEEKKGAAALPLSTPLSQPREAEGVITPAASLAPRDTPTIPAMQLPLAPAPAPAPVKLETPKKDVLPDINGDLPPLEFVLPKLLDQAKPDAAAKPTRPEIPTFEIPLPMSQPVEANKKQVTQASPLNAERNNRVDIYTVEGEAPSSPTAKRVVGFINKSARDVLLTVDGQSVVLPAKNLIRAELPASFTWQIGGEAAKSQVIGSTVAGLDIVIRN